MRREWQVNGRVSLFFFFRLSPAGTSDAFAKIKINVLCYETVKIYVGLTVSLSLPPPPPPPPVPPKIFE